jgi:hypothetical protein
MHGVWRDSVSLLYITIKDHGYIYNFILIIFYFTKFLNMAMVRSSEFMLGQTVNKSVILCNVILMKTTHLVIIKSNTTGLQLAR